jgi:predicted SAM-dependent methyltransferase
MNILGRLRRSLGHRGLKRTLSQMPRAALRPLVLAWRTAAAAKRAPGLVQAMQPARLHLGSGPDRREGWINVDLYFPAELCLDLTRPLPLPDACVDAIYSQHFIEHIGKDQVAGLVRECARVLRPGGWLRLSTPDLAYQVAQWQALSSQPGATGSAAADVLNDAMRQHDHLYLYDYAALSDLFARARLSDIQRARPQESQSPLLRGLETRLIGTPEDEARQDLIIEACRAPQ